MIESDKHSRLLQYGNNYCRKKFYSTGTRCLKVRVNVGIQTILKACCSIEASSSYSLIRGKLANSPVPTVTLSITFYNIFNSYKNEQTQLWQHWVHRMQDLTNSQFGHSGIYVKTSFIAERFFFSFSSFYDHPFGRMLLHLFDTKMVLRHSVERHSA